ncbi:MAG: hypothetical protein D6714_00560, partial [Bacteroidetes bacterium]
VQDSDFGVEDLRNWSLSASLQFYLGGRRPGQMSELDELYFKTFSGGFRSLSVPFEPTLAKINWDDNLPYRDTWMGGGYLGLNFGPYVGVRGFYLRAMNNGEIDLNFDDLAMYGGELRMKLNVAEGITPYLMVGGGYIDVNADYVAKDSIGAESQPFALGGVGLNIPISPNFKLFGGVRANLTSGQNVEDIATTNDIQTSWMYSFGINLTMGKKAEKPEAIFKSEMEAAIAAREKENEAQANKLKAEYEAKVAELEAQLNEAYAAQDVEKAAEILQEKETAEEIVDELNAREAERNAKKAQEEKAKVDAVLNPAKTNTFAPGSRIQLTPAEFENLIEEILENMGANGQTIAPAVGQQLTQQQDMNQVLHQQEIEKRLEEIEKMLLTLTERQAADGEITATERAARDESIKRDLTEFSAKLLAEIQKIDAKV